MLTVLFDTWPGQCPGFNTDRRFVTSCCCQGSQSRKRLANQWPCSTESSVPRHSDIAGTMLEQNIRCIVWTFAFWNRHMVTRIFILGRHHQPSLFNMNEIIWRCLSQFSARAFSVCTVTVSPAADSGARWKLLLLRSCYLAGGAASWWQKSSSVHLNSPVFVWWQVCICIFTIEYLVLALVLLYVFVIWSCDLFVICCVFLLLQKR